MYDRIRLEDGASADAAQRWCEKVLEARQTAPKRGSRRRGGGVLAEFETTDGVVFQFGDWLWQQFSVYGARCFVGAIDAQCKSGKGFANGYGRAPMAYLESCLENWRPPKRKGRIQELDKARAAAEEDYQSAEDVDFGGQTS